MKDVLRIVKNVLVGAVAVVAVAMMIFTIISVTTFNRTDRSLFGYKPLVVLSDSMSATDFSAGDLIFVREVDPSALQEGDIIAFRSSASETFGEIITHKIRSLTTDETGAPAFVTYGTTTGTDDEALVGYDDVVGLYQFRMPRLGSFFQFLKTTPGYLLCIFLPFALLIAYQTFNSVRLFRRYKKEQTAEMRAEWEKQQAELARERKRLQEEQRRSRQMLEQLMQLKREMYGEQADQAGVPEQPTRRKPPQTATARPAQSRPVPREPAAESRANSHAAPAARPVSARPAPDGTAPKAGLSPESRATEIHLRAGQPDKDPDAGSWEDI